MVDFGMQGFLVVGVQGILAWTFALRPYQEEYDFDFRLLNYLWLCVVVAMASALPYVCADFKEMILTSQVMLSLFALSIIDSYTLQIPSRLQLSGLVGALLMCLLKDGVSEALYTSIPFAVLIFGVLLAITKLYEVVRKREGMGRGDIKLIGWLALLFGQNIIYVIVSACALSAIVIIYKKIKGSSLEPFAFGPSLSLSATIGLVLFLNQ